MKRVLLVAPFTTLPGEGGRNRFQSLAELFAEDYDCHVITSRFHHLPKKHRTLPAQFTTQAGYQVTLLDEPGYQTNVSVKRFFSHRAFVTHLRQTLDVIQMPDLVYSAFPLIGSNLVLGRWCQRQGIPLVVDVQDVWPESFASVIPALKPRFNDVLWPLSYRANKAYRAADAVVAVSKTYLDRALSARKTPCPGVSVYIGSDDQLIQSMTSDKAKDNDRFSVVYIGTLSHSYDVATLVRAANQLNGLPISISVLGTGPDYDELVRLNHSLGGRVIFTGQLPFEQMIQQLQSADLAVNAIRAGASQSFTNKLSDYFSLGLPLLSSQTCPEVKALLASSGAGQYYPAGDAEALAQAIINLYQQPEQLGLMRERSADVGRRYFRRSQTYPAIVALIRDLLGESC